jgi:hypothetical protein
MIRTIAVALLAGSVATMGQVRSHAIDFGPDDPVRKDPRRYHLEFENEEVRVVRARLGAGERGVLHEHPCGRVVVYLTPAHQALVDAASGTRTETRAARGDVRWSTPARHTDENLADAPFEVLSIDVKSSCPQK